MKRERMIVAHFGNQRRMLISGVSALAFGLLIAAPVAAQTTGASDAVSQAPTGITGTSEPAQQQAAQAVPDANSGTLLSDIVVTATKQSRAQAIQSVPVTISAFNAKQIDNLKLTNISRLAYAMPNVSFETPGSTKSTANFTIRGLGVNSSIASTAPTVGVFTNGMYLGINQGVLVDTFDLEGVEVLRGPQGTLFGRNVTGGAVLLNSRKPQQEADLTIRGRLETGPEYNIAAAGGGALTDTISARLAVMYRLDEGYFNNVTLKDKHFGRDEVFLVRPSVRLQTGGTDVTVFGEYGKNTGDGPVATAPDYMGGTTTVAGTQPARGYKYDEVYENFRGLTDLEWYSVVLNGTQEVGFGEDGQLALISGYRNFKGASQYASDGTELTISHNGGYTSQSQVSNELRYNGKFGIATATIGLYQFSQTLTQFNKQNVINATQAGRLKERTYGVFGQVDLAFTDQFSVQLGGRYSYEKKDAKIAPLGSETLVARPGTFGTPGACIFDTRVCDYKYSLKDDYKNFSPKIGVRYKVDNVLLYATAQKAFRSGGFNVRYNSAGTPPPYDAEKQDAFEIGFKSDLFDRKTRFNGAVFLTKVKDLQRDITIFLPDLTNQTSTFNTADATTKGFELEFVQQIVPQVIFNANLGYVHAKYDKIRFDITQDPASAGGPAVNALDYQQKLPRVSPWTYSTGITAAHDFAFGKVTFIGNYSHRDASFFPDYNTNRRDGAVPKLPASDIFDAQISFDPLNSGISLTLFGRNLTNEYTLSSFTPIVYPTFKGCACNPNEGRVFGIEASIKL